MDVVRVNQWVKVVIFMMDIVMNRVMNRLIINCMVMGVDWKHLNV